MADPLSIAASVVGVTTAGVQVTLALFTLAETLRTAPDRIRNIANDISSTCAILNQLKDLMEEKSSGDGGRICIFNSEGLLNIKQAVAQCEGIFNTVDGELKKASKQLQQRKLVVGHTISLSRSERAKWPFLQSKFDDLRSDLRDSKSNLLLLVTVATLAHAEKIALETKSKPMDTQERNRLTTTIITLSSASHAHATEKKGKISRHSSKSQKFPLRRGLENEAEKFSERSMDGNSSRVTILVDKTDVNKSPAPYSDFLTISRPDWGPGNAPPLRTDASMSEKLIAAMKAEKSTISSENQDDSPNPKNIAEPESSVVKKDASNTDIEMVGETTVSNAGHTDAGSRKASYSPKPKTRTLQAWITGVAPGMISGLGRSISILPVSLPISELEARVNQSSEQGLSVIEHLTTLNIHQRNLILSHVSRTQLQLLCVDKIQKEIVSTVFGDIEISLLIWITASDQATTGLTFDQLEKLEKEEKEKELEEAMRKRLAQFGFQDNQLEAIIDPKNIGPQPGLTPAHAASTVSPPFTKIHSKHLDIETLRYYQLPWEYDKYDPNYIIILQKIDDAGAEILFEHSRRIRSQGVTELLIEDRGRKQTPEYAFVRRRREPRNRRHDLSTFTVEESKMSSPSASSVPSAQSGTQSESYYRAYFPAGRSGSKSRNRHVIYSKLRNIFTGSRRHDRLHELKIENSTENLSQGRVSESGSNENSEEIVKDLLMKWTTVKLDDENPSVQDVANSVFANGSQHDKKENSPISS